jgi:hypothetical protein
MPVRKNITPKTFSVMIILALGIPAAQWSAPAWSEPPKLGDDEIFALIKDAGEKEDYPDDHALVAYHHTDVSVEDTGLSHVVERRIVKILDAEGIKDNSVVRFNYDPATQLCEIRWARIYKKNGSVVKMDLKGVPDLPQPLWGIYWPSRMKLLHASGLEPGDALAYEVYRKGFQIAYLLNPSKKEDDKYIPPMKGHYYDVVLFEETVPVKEKKYEIHMSRKKPFHWEIYNGTVAAKHVFDDDRQPDRTDFVTKLVLATVKSWQEKSVWFFEVNEPVFAFDAAIKQKVKEITAKGKTDDEKVKLLLRWVAHKIRYSGITMGKGEGYTIHPGIMTFNDRSGVCKDIAGMLITMMRAAGYEVYPAMTMAGARVEKVPADQFNHCVVAWKKKDGTFEMLDPTWMPFDVDTWSLAEGEQDYLIGTKGGEGLKQTQAFLPEENRFVISGSSAIDGKGNLGGKLTVKATGYPDTRMRRAFAYQAAKENEAFYHHLFSEISPLLAVEKFEKGDHADLEKPFFVKAAYSVPGYAAASKKQVRFTVPLAHYVLRQERWSPYLMLGPWKERKNPAMFWFPQLVTVKETVKLPSGFTVRDLPDARSFDGDLVSYSFKLNIKGTTLTYEAEWKIKNRIALKKHFDELGKLVDEIEKMQGLEIVLESKKKGGGK